MHLAVSIDGPLVALASACSIGDHARSLEQFQPSEKRARFHFEL